MRSTPCKGQNGPQEQRSCFSAWQQYAMAIIACVCIGGACPRLTNGIVAQSITKGDNSEADVLTLLQINDQSNCDKAKAVEAVMAQNEWIRHGNDNSSQKWQKHVDSCWAKHRKRQLTPTATTNSGIGLGKISR
jgi:hypothetical protein